MEAFSGTIQQLVAARDRSGLTAHLLTQPVDYLERVAHRSVAQRVDKHGQVRPLRGLVELVADMLMQSGFLRGDSQVYYGCYANGWRVVDLNTITAPSSYTSHELMTLREAVPAVYYKIMKGQPRAVFLINVTHHEVVNTYRQPADVAAIVKAKYWSGPQHANDRIEARIRYYNYKNRDYVDKTEEYVTQGLYQSTDNQTSPEVVYSDSNNRTNPTGLNPKRTGSILPNQIVVTRPARPQLIPLNITRPVVATTTAPPPDSPLINSPVSPLTQEELKQEQERAAVSHRILLEIKARVQARYPNIDSVIAAVKRPSGPNHYLLVTEDFVVAALKPDNSHGQLMINERLLLMWPSRLLASLTDIPDQDNLFYQIITDLVDYLK